MSALDNYREMLLNYTSRKEVEKELVSKDKTFIDEILKLWDEKHIKITIVKKAPITKIVDKAPVTKIVAKKSSQTIVKKLKNILKK